MTRNIQYVDQYSNQFFMTINDMVKTIQIIIGFFKTITAV